MINKQKRNFLYTSSNPFPSAIADTLPLLEGKGLWMGLFKAW
jgi:hypothetical protein